VDEEQLCIEEMEQSTQHMSFKVAPVDNDKVHVIYLFRYLTGISVAKYVIVLIDVSPTMDDQLTPFLLSYSYLQASQNISMALLGTLLQADYVNILTFDNAQALPLNTNAVRFLHPFLKHNFIEGTK
jgi:hypothetical protein